MDKQATVVTKHLVLASSETRCSDMATWHNEELAKPKETPTTMRTEITRDKIKCEDGIEVGSSQSCLITSSSILLHFPRTQDYILIA